MSTPTLRPGVGLYRCPARPSAPLRRHQRRERLRERLAPVADRLDAGRRPPVVAQHAVRGPGRGAYEGRARGGADPLRVGAEPLEDGPGEAVPGRLAGAGAV